MKTGDTHTKLRIRPFVRLCLFVAMICAPGTAGAAENVGAVAIADRTTPQVAPKNQSPDMSLLESPIRIPLKQTRTFSFAAKAQAGRAVLLKITSRMDADRPAGSSWLLNIKLNGKEIGTTESRTITRLMNKPLVSPVTPTVSGPWGNAKGDWVVVYAPDFKTAREATFYADDPYTLLLDVTDLLDAGGRNQLEVANTATEKTQTYARTKADLVIADLAVITKAGPSPLLDKSAAFPQRLLNRGEPAAGAASYTGNLLPGGGFALYVGSETYLFSSSFSYPNAGFNHLRAGSGNKAKQDAWKVNVDSTSGRVVAEGLDYKVERIIQFKPTHVEISDTITNLHKDAPLGMAVRDEMDLSRLKNPQVRVVGRLRGNDYFSPGNPSVHVTTPTGAIGIIATGDLFRHHAVVHVDEIRNDQTGRITLDNAGLRTRTLWLDKGASHQLQWAVYPVAGPDYYDFVNLVRNDWEANEIVKGGVWWMRWVDRKKIIEMPLEDLRKSLVESGVHYVQILGEAWRYPRELQHTGYGAAVFNDDGYAEVRKEIRGVADKLHQALPGTIAVAYYDSQRDNSPDSAKRYADSWLTNESGSQVHSWGCGALVPTLENSFGKEMISVAERYMSDLGLDGIFYDEFESEIYGQPLLTYNRSDDSTCLLDPKTWTIRRRVGNTTLLSAPFHKAVVKSIQDKGGVVLGNGPATTLASLHSGVIRLIEIWHKPDWAYEGHLGTPLSYMAQHTMDATAGWAATLYSLDLAYLPIFKIGPKGNGFGFDFDIMPYLFPFTPIELHAGYLLGQERIITTHSGQYGWENERVLSLSHHFDSKGKLTSERFPARITSQETRTAVKLGDKEAAVLVKVPVTVNPPADAPPSWSAEATVGQYGPHAVKLEINAPHGALLTLRNGDFPARDGKSISIRFDNGAAVAEQTLKWNGSSLNVAIPTGFHGSCTIVSADTD